MTKPAKVVEYFVTTPLTDFGVPLGDPPALTSPRFTIHECGYLPEGLATWGAAGVMSPFWRLWYMEGEGYSLEADGRRIEMSPEHLVFAPAQLVYTTRPGAPAPHFWMHFSLLSDYAFESTSAFTLRMDDLLRHQLEAVIATHYMPGEDAVRVLYHHAAALLHNCFARFPLQLRNIPETLRHILQHIENEAGTDLSNALLARQANLSRSGFIRWFEQHMEQSPAAYVQRTRLNQASRLLMLTDLSIEQIAADVGFANRYYFSRAFAKHFKCGPALFRRQHRLLPR